MWKRAAVAGCRLPSSGSCDGCGREGDAHDGERDRLEIVYCAESGFRSFAAGLAKRIERRFGLVADLVEGHDGIWEVRMNGRIVHSIEGPAAPWFPATGSSGKSPGAGHPGCAARFPSTAGASREPPPPEGIPKGREK
jgi:hypothetical protein